jgi:hypothetical protein
VLLLTSRGTVYAHLRVECLGLTSLIIIIFLPLLTVFFFWNVFYQFKMSSFEMGQTIKDSKE